VRELDERLGFGDLIAQNRTDRHPRWLGVYGLPVRKPKWKSWPNVIDLHPKSVKRSIATISYLGMGHSAKSVNLSLVFCRSCR
jgi:hypothetical protein